MTIGDPTIFPVRHDWATRFKVTRESLTDIQIADDGTEIRTALRSSPHISTQWRGVFLSELGAGRLPAAWRGSAQPLRFYAPLWCDVTELSTAVVAGDAILECDTTTRPFFAIDSETDLGYAMLYRELGGEPGKGGITAEVVSYNMVDDGLLLLAAGTTNSYAVAGTKVVPCRVMWLTMPQNVTWLNGRIATADLAFVEEVAQAAYALSDSAGTVAPASLQVVLDRRCIAAPCTATARAIVKDANGVPLDASRLGIVWTKEEPGGTSVTIIPSLNAEYARCNYVSGGIVADVGVTATLGALTDTAAF